MEEDTYNSNEQLKAYSQSLASTVRHTTTALSEIQSFGESQNVEPAKGDLCDGCKTTERIASDSAEHDRSLQETYAALSITSVADSEIYILAGAYTPENGCGVLAPIHHSELPSGLYKNNGKPTIDRNFFKSMAKTIKANRASIADVEVVDQEACTHYTGYYTSSSCGEESRYVNWIEGDAMRMRIELKLRLIHERMLAPEASKNRRLRR